MKKALIILLVAALSLSALALAGCGAKESGDKAKAQEYMLAGDGYYDTFVEKWDGLQEQQTSLFMQVLGGDKSAIEGAAGEALSKQFDDLFVDMEADLADANDQYKQITGLKDVTDYEDYAGLMQEAIAVWEDVLKTAKELKPLLTQALADFVAGKITAQEIQAMMLEGEEVQMLTTLAEEATAKAEEAEELQDTKKLAE